MSALPEACSPDQNARRSDRVDFPAAVQFRTASKRATVQVRDLSELGARISALHKLREGESFWITLPGLEAREAKVVWNEEFELGCEFKVPLHAAVVNNLLRGNGRV